MTRAVRGIESAPPPVLPLDVLPTAKWLAVAGEGGVAPEALRSVADPLLMGANLEALALR